MWLDDFRTRVEQHPNATAIIAREQRFTYRQFWDRSAAAGATACREQPGPRHWVSARDPLAFLEAVLGAWIRDKTPVAITPEMPAETQRLLRERTLAEPPRQADPERREALVMGTSGSTGLPKLAVLPQTHLSLGVGSIARWYGLPEGSQALVATPLSTSTALLSTTLAGLSCGWAIHLYPAGTPGSVLQACMHTHSIEVMNGSSSFFRVFFGYWHGTVFPTLRFNSATGEPGSRNLLEQMHTAFPKSQTNVIYGMTETGRTGMVSTHDPRAARGGCGVPMPHVEARLIPVPGVEPPTGELLVRGPTIMLGYLEGNGGYTGLDAEGFLHTGDIMRPDPDGCLMCLGRISRLVKVGGLLVNPREVEQVLLQLPGVADAMCWAEPHELLGYQIAAMVTEEPGAVLDEQKLRRECAARVEHHK
ncbi:MAG TPA: class I adenylate-forming enzyme family protein, partial [bacterium]